MSTSGSKELWVAQTLKDKAPFCEAIIISEQDPAILSRLEAESGFVCLAKTRLASELALTPRPFLDNFRLAKIKRPKGL
jgi:hypothetical protein